MKARTQEEKFETIIESFINGQRTQAREQFKRLKKAERKACILYAGEFDTEAKDFLFNLL